MCRSPVSVQGDMVRKSGPKHGFRYGLVAAGLCRADGAVINAIHRATDARARDFPGTPDKLGNAFTLIALTCSVLPFVEHCISHRGLETAHDALAVGLSDPRSGLFDANRDGRSMCDAT
jgi:hypothetical protein